MVASNLVYRAYVMLLDRFGPQGWWPAESDFEMMVGAILTQNTAWSNVEKAITALRENSRLDPFEILAASDEELEHLIRPSGYYRQKADRLKRLSSMIVEDLEGDLDTLFERPVLAARDHLLSIKGIGPETADSILLYAGRRPVFVIDAYTLRIAGRLGITQTGSYAQAQRIFTRNVPVDVPLYQEYHALLVKLGKDYCRKDRNRCRCADCPLEAQCETDLLS